jgi:hypothetical protein
MSHHWQTTVNLPPQCVESADGGHFNIKLNLDEAKAIVEILKERIDELAPQGKPPRGKR